MFDFSVVGHEGDDRVFLRAPNSPNHHDLGLERVRPRVLDAPEGAPGLGHIAWSTPQIADLLRYTQVLATEGALSGASDHGAAKSVYGCDPDGNTFEILWRVPRDYWGPNAEREPWLPLDLTAEMMRWRVFTTEV